VCHLADAPPTPEAELTAPFLRQQFNLGLQREDAIEMYYNMAVTPWMNVTSDLQIVIQVSIEPSTRRPGNSPASTPSSWPQPRLRLRF
jgi:carbohydrate-selective porin OprB